MVVDTFHLFPETMTFLNELEKHYKFKAEVFQAVGCADKAEYDKKVPFHQHLFVCCIFPSFSCSLVPTCGRLTSSSMTRFARSSHSSEVSPTVL